MNFFMLLRARKESQEKGLQIPGRMLLIYFLRFLFFCLETSEARKLKYVVSAYKERNFEMKMNGEYLT